MCEFPDRECPFCEYGYVIDSGVIPVQIIAYCSGDVFWGCNLDDASEQKEGV